MSRLAKNSLRKTIKGELNKLSETSVNKQSDHVYEALIKDRQFQNAKSIAVFMSMPRLEVNTEPIIKYCFDHGKSVFLPKCSPPGLGSTMTFLKVDTFDEVKALQPAGKYQLREPSHGEDASQTGALDLIVVPGVAFTCHGDRLGHGAGYYDKFLRDFRAKFDRVPYLIGVCLAAQLVKNIPTESHDWAMDNVITAAE